MMRRVLMSAGTAAGLVGLVAAAGFVRGQEAGKRQEPPKTEKHEAGEATHVESVGIAKPRLGFITRDTFENKPVQFTPIGGRAIFEGDIDLGPASELDSSALAEVRRRAGRIDVDALDVPADVKASLKGLKEAPADVAKPQVDNRVAYAQLADIASRLSAVADADDATKQALRKLGQQVPTAEGEGDEPSVSGIGLPGSRFRWPRGVIPFEIDPTLPSPQRVQGAIAHWHARTGIRLVPRRPGQVNFVRFVPGGGCSSRVGMVGGRQDIVLAAGCTQGSTIHEIGHSVGLWHEQSREDRNGRIRILFQNIEPDAIHNFNQHIVDGDDIGVYDFGSIMHYPRKAFSKNGLDTIIPLGGQAIGQRNALSSGDIAAVVFLYPGLRPSGDEAESNYDEDGAQARKKHRP